MTASKVIIGRAMWVYSDPRSTRVFVSR